ncbi:MAG: hypothetical protein JXR05_08010 [Flavobacteriaceae bacterium]
MNSNWLIYNNGKTIGETGSENGEIILDEEHSLGARVSLEKDGDIAPFSITLGIYGLLLHTDFYSDIDSAKLFFNTFKQKIEVVLKHYSIPENKRNSDWQNQLNQLVDDLVYKTN